MNYYNILQIDENASSEEIRQAYHKMARLFHPDNFNGSKEDAEEQMRKINEAYRILSDPEEKKNYDAGIVSNKDNIHVQDEVENEYAENKESNKESVIVEENGSSGCSSCLSKIIEWIICLGIICFVVNHFGVVEKIDDLINGSPVNSVMERLDTGGDEKVVSPEKVVEKYFRYLKSGKTKKANELFSTDADEMFSHDGTVEQYNKVAYNIYHGVEKNIPWYPLFDEIKNFSYVVSTSGENENTAQVSVYIENCDIALLGGLLLQADEGELSSMSDHKFRKLVKSALEQYKEECMISTDATFVLVKQDGWKIKKITPLKDFSNVLWGQANDLILGLDGEDINDSDLSEESDDDDSYDEGLLP